MQYRDPEILAMTPDFAEIILETPPNQRHGYVFDPLPQNDGKGRLSVQTVSRTIADISQSAGVIVDNRNDKPSNGSAHDLRRAFGARLASRVMPAVLQELMRHSAIETTMRYYVRTNAEKTAAGLWGDFAQSESQAFSKSANADSMSG